MVKNLKHEELKFVWRQINREKFETQRTNRLFYCFQQPRYLRNLIIIEVYMQAVLKAWRILFSHL